mmetsp:Transcript_16041/g.20305  ORF Transcript_16041/g.20305 Transcript_16041/m.20305 type:complete len:304 (-) Transcript_16041:207-1118(-)|eukprot:CAMPEP_0170469656 /NCGR_PEP_ID=MMETSP0123-20130129/12414_1 /TAXON_ID=182087 /ORGANISM="Favella ehrenbergii, Strain Fehren 1" /LENGTH=303 /DNA_ID=CAMNT_0010736599 /DNA_START=65 /DNA_END=976 /DNA_ORIENTATION=+
MEKELQKSLSRGMDVIEPFLKGFGDFVTPYMTKLVSWGDPVTVIITLFILLSPIALMYICFTRIAFVKLSQMSVKGKNILYVIAHPDDEAMFFQPSILEFLSQGNKLYLLCLSNGNFEGLGREREKELEKSCARLGFTEPPMIIDDPELQDGMDVKWAPGLIADYVVKHCKQRESLDGESAKIDIIVTFDEGGVSGHPNHIAIFEGISHLMKHKLLADIEIFTLTTVMLFRKYIAIADVNFIFADEWQAFRLNFIEAYMTLAEHATQLVWFRKLFIVFSRYTYVNSFTRYISTDKARSQREAD